MSADEVLDRLSQQGRAEYSAYFDEDGAVDLKALLAAGKGHLVKGTKPTKYGLEVEFYDAQTALVQLGRKHGLFQDKVTGDLTITQRPDLSGLTDEELAAIERIYAAAQSRRDPGGEGQTASA
jgi:hypothetical protein